MNKGEDEHQTSHTQHHQEPGTREVTAIASCQETHQRSEHTRSKDHRQAISRGTDSHKERLRILVECLHVEAVTRDVVSCRREGAHRQGDETPRQPIAAEQRECHTSNADRQGHLHEPHPTTSVANPRTPKRLERPWHSQERRPCCHFGVRQSHIGHHHHAQRSNDCIRQALSEIRAEDPP